MIDKEYILTEQDIIVTKTNINGVITYVNDDTLRITGFSEQELIGSNHNIFRHTDMPAEVFSDLWRTILNKSTWRGIIKNKTKDGHFYWVRADVTPLYENDFIIGYISVRRKAANKDIKKAEEVYAQMKAGTFQGKLSYGDIQESYVFQNFKCKLNNLSIGTRLSVLLCLNTFFVLLLVTVNFSNLNELNEDHLNNLSQIQSLSTEVNIAHTRQHATDQQSILSESPSVMLKKSKEEIKLGDYFYQAKTRSNQNLLNIQNETILIVFLSLIVLIVLCELIIRSIVIPLKDATRTLMQISSGNYHVLVEHHSKSEIGQMIDALRSTSVRLGFDIANEKKISSEIIRVHEKNLALNAEINQLQRLESIARMTAGISHNFNNNLGAIIGYNQLNCYAAEDCQDEMLKQEILENTQQIQIASDRSVELVKQMMAYTNQNSARKFREMKSIVMVIDEVLEMIDTSLTKRFQIQTNIDSNLDFQFDATDLHLILTALMINARDAMQEKGGVITVTLKKITFNEVVCSSCLTAFEGECIELCVSDQGIGIDNHVITHIFDPFFTLKPTGEGIGLGLTTASGLVHEANGHIIVESKTTEHDSGTIFRLLFPIANEAF